MHKQQPAYKIDPAILERMKLKLAEKRGVVIEEPKLEPANETAFYSERSEDGYWEWPVAPIEQSESITPDHTGTDRFGNTITFNSEQYRAIEFGGSGKDCIIVGAAGTGKTTVTKAVIEKLIDSGRAGILDSQGHKHLPSGTPGVVCVSYTRRAVTNLRKNMSADMKTNCCTIHKLLEYQPIFYEVEDPKTGQLRKVMRFEPTRHKQRPLPTSIHTLVIDESSMVSVELYRLILDAQRHQIQVIFLGDIQQLPPTFGSAILGYKMLELPVVELKTVYRQALESPIIRLAHRILSGKPIPKEEYKDWDFAPKLKLHPWAKKISGENACIVFSNFMCKRFEAGVYDPEEDMILCPYNKAFGTDEINKHIAQHLAKHYNSVVWEVIAGFNKHYFRVGEKVLYDREDAIITRIVRNGRYYGVHAQPESTTLSYWGFDAAHATAVVDDTDFLLQQMANKSADVEDRVNVASHIVTVRLVDSEEEIDIESASEINSLLMGYALTVHKAQGSEWRRVFLAIHSSHATMTSRELLYTAVTRAKEELYIVCEPETFTKGILSQRIKGNTLAEKAEFFKGKLEENNGKLLG